ncbi:MAG TPA: hypothetical protein VF221_02550, partial [Chloroflexota bacterium]
MPRSEPEIRAAYPELLEPGGDREMVQAARLLDAGYGLHRVPPALLSNVPRRLPGAGWSAGASRYDAPQSGAADRRGGSAGARIRWMLGAALACVAAVALLVLSGVTLAGSPAPDITKLGKPTNDVSQYLPAGGFHRIGTYLHQGTRPEVLFIGTLADSSSAAARWPLVKALAQFGTFSKIKPALQSCSHAAPTPGPSNPEHEAALEGGREPCGAPTFDLLHSIYYSRYLVFTEKDVLDQANRVYINRLSPLERTLYDRYARTTAYPTEVANIWASAIGFNP